MGREIPKGVGYPRREILWTGRYHEEEDTLWMVIPWGKTKLGREISWGRRYPGKGDKWEGDTWRGRYPGEGDTDLEGDILRGR